MTSILQGGAYHQPYLLNWIQENRVCSECHLFLIVIIHWCCLLVSGWRFLAQMNKKQSLTNEVWSYHVLFNINTVPLDINIVWLCTRHLQHTSQSFMTSHNHCSHEKINNIHLYHTQQEHWDRIFVFSSHGYFAIFTWLLHFGTILGLSHIALLKTKHQRGYHSDKTV